MGPLKHQHLTTLQMHLDDTACCLRVHTPIIATPGILKITLDLGFYLDNHNDLGTGLHQFGLGQHTSATRKVLKDRSDQNQVFADGGAAPYLDDAATLTAPDGVSLPATMAMAWGPTRD